MNTLIVKLPPGLAHRLEVAGGHIGMTREQAATEAIRLFTRSVAAEANPESRTPNPKRRRSHGR
jgi:hypothetical protein